MPILTASERERLRQAVVYFATQTRYCGKIKLFKLLFLLDFEHFRQTGKSVTGLDYQAWKFGPVPVEVMEEWEELGEDLGALVKIVPEPQFDYIRQTVVALPGVQVDEEAFTPRQLRILAELAQRYRNTQSAKLIDVTHAQNGAWDRVWRGGEGQREPIPYELALADDAPQREQVLAVADEQAMYRAALQAARRNSASNASLAY